MKSKSILLFVVAIGCGTVAMVGVQKSLSRNRNSNQEATVKVLVAVTEIEAGVPLDATNSAFKSLPKSSVPEGAVTKPEQFENRALRVRAYPGDLILQAKLSEGFGATVDIPEGMRVVTISVDATKTHSGLMLPGNRVDVLCSYRAQKANNKMVQRTRVVLENIKVFATDNRRDAGKTESGENAAKNISLLVTPEQGAMLHMSETKGKLHLALRRDNDTIEGNAFTVDDEAFDDEAVGIGDSGNESLFDAGGATAKVTSAEPAEPKATELEVVAEPTKPKWKINIFSGGEMKVQEVDIPENPLPVLPANESSDGHADGRIGTGAKLKGLVIKFFAGV